MKDLFTTRSGRVWIWFAIISRGLKLYKTSTLSPCNRLDSSTGMPADAHVSERFLNAALFLLGNRGGEYTEIGPTNLFTDSTVKIRCLCKKHYGFLFTFLE